jgi:hypothetical protein
MAEYTDQALITLVRPPDPLAEAFLKKDRETLRILLNVLFSSHELNHFTPGSPDNNVDVWTDDSDTIYFRNMYGQDTVHPKLAEIAPDWHAYVHLAETWHHEFPFGCAEYDDWFWGHDEDPASRSLDFFRVMLINRISAEGEREDS